MIGGDQLAQGEYPDEIDDDQEELQALKMQKSIETSVRRRYWGMAGRCVASRIKDAEYQ